MTKSTVLEREPAKPSVDPRLRARRIEVRRKEGRRRLRRLLIALGITIVCAAAWGITRSALLDVDHIEVDGVVRTEVDAIVAAGGIERGDPISDLDLAAAADSIRALAWVRSVEVSKSWGGTVQYTVVERQPAAVLSAADGSSWLVDRDAWILGQATPADIDRLPLVRGIQPSSAGTQIDETHRASVAVATALSPGLAQWVEAIVVDADGSVWLDLSSPQTVDVELIDARVRLGDARDLPAQLVATETVLNRVELQCLAQIDVRVGSAPVVTRHEGCEALS